MNRTTRYHTDKLARLFQEQKIATMEELKRALGTRVDVTVFRKLASLDSHGIKCCLTLAVLRSKSELEFLGDGCVSAGSAGVSPAPRTESAAA